MKNNFRIIKIIDDETIVINAGTQNNIKEGAKFEIYEIGNDIIDPETKENLGSLDTIKDTVEAINVLEKMCICRHIINYNPLSNIAITMASSLIATKNKQLNVETKDISGGLTSDLTIRIGDKVRLVKE